LNKCLELTFTLDPSRYSFAQHYVSSHIVCCASNHQNNIEIAQGHNFLSRSHSVMYLILGEWLVPYCVRLVCFGGGATDGELCSTMMQLLSRGASTVDLVRLGCDLIEEVTVRSVSLICGIDSN
jgi:hypothetical protein